MNLPIPLPIQPEEIEVLQPRDRLSVSEWAMQRRKLSPKTSEFDGNWTHDYSPFLVEIMDRLSDVGTRQVTVQKCTQGGGTEITLNFFGWAIEESPGPLLMVMPTETDANRRVNTKIRFMFESTPSLLRHLPNGRLDNLNIGKETILDNMILYLGWSGSPAALADNAVCYVILDEVGKYPMGAGKEADPVSLAYDRLRTFYTRSKLLLTSSPVLEDDLINREYKQGDRRKWWSMCQHCGEFHVLKWENVVLDKTAQGKLLDPKQYETGDHSRYVCPICGVGWSEQERWLAAAAGRWCPEGCKVVSGRIVGDVPVTTHHSYNITSFMLYPAFNTIARLSKKWVEAQVHRKAGDIGPLQNVINSEFGEPWVEAEKETDKDKLRTHIGNYRMGTVPEGVRLLTVGIDVQDDHFWVIVIGWGVWSESWLIYAGRIQSGDTRFLENYRVLKEFLYRSWASAVPDEPGWYLNRAGIDSRYRQDTVFDFCREFHGNPLVPVRGDDAVKAVSYRPKDVAGGQLKCFNLNVGIFKNRIHWMAFDQKQSGSGYLHLPQDCPPEVINHLTSEHQIKIKSGGKFRLLWKPKKTSRPNHLWDAFVYAMAAGEIAGMYAISDEPAEAAGPQPDRKQKKNRDGFIDRVRPTGGWLKR